MMPPRYDALRRTACWMTRRRLLSTLYLLTGAVLIHLNTAAAGDAPIDAPAQSDTASANESPIVPPVKRVMPRMPENAAKPAKTPRATKTEQGPKPDKKSGN